MAQYRFLSDHYVNGVYFQAGTTSTTADVGGPLPSGWVPSGNVDPQDNAAVQAFWAAGPQMSGKVQQQWTGVGVGLPKTRWVAMGQPGQPGLYQLTGLGAALGPLQWFGAAPAA